MNWRVLSRHRNTAFAAIASIGVVSLVDLIHYAIVVATANPSSFPDYLQVAVAATIAVICVNVVLIVAMMITALLLFYSVYKRNEDLLKVLIWVFGGLVVAKGVAVLAYIVLRIKLSMSGVTAFVFAGFSALIGLWFILVVFVLASHYKSLERERITAPKAPT